MVMEELRMLMLVPEELLYVRILRASFLRQRSITEIDDICCSD